MENTTGLIIVTIAGIFQGSFILPMTYTRNWEWAHKWFAFSLFGMLVLNWAIALLSIESLVEIIFQIPSSLLIVVLLFGFGWGTGAILFGKGMDLLGMALGYPIIMGINAAAGTIIPAVIFSPAIFLQTKGYLIIAGAILTIVGIIACAKASSMKTTSGSATDSKQIEKGLVIAVVAGFTSCLPNMSAAFSSKITSIALDSGVSSILAGNVVWSLFFTAGAVVNAVYCLIILQKSKSIRKLWGAHPVANWLLMLLMSVIWISSFYFYGIGCSMLDDFGLIVGWPLLITLSILIGNLWGLYRGEWNIAPVKSKKLLNLGLFILTISIILIAMSNHF